MNIMHENVNHSIFGCGEVIAQSDSTITVRFQADNEEKKFLYPQAFSQYLTLSSTTLAPELQSELSVLQEQMIKERQRIEAARLAERLTARTVTPATKTKSTSRTRAKK